MFVNREKQQSSKRRTSSFLETFFSPSQNIMNGVVKRPPLPLGRSIKADGPTQETTPLSDLDTSENSRTSLRRSLLQRRPTLTMRETNFLERLIETGNEVEVQVAYENLLNEKLFFETVDDFAPDDDGEAAFRTSSVGSARSSIYSKSMSSLDQLIVEDVARYMQEENRNNLSCGGSTDGLGSERRQELLQKRRMSNVFGKIWQAHENGLAVTPHGSRKSMMVRSKSLRQMKSPARTEDIFRSRPRRSSSTRKSSQSFVIPRFQGRCIDSATPSKEYGEKELMDDTKSDNNRTRPVVPLSPASQKPVRPSLRRLSSDVSRKSVTFDVPVPGPDRIGDRAFSDSAARFFNHLPNELPPRPKILERETSDMSRRTENSVPSIHMAHPVRSYSTRSDGDDSTLQEIDGAFKPLLPSSPPSIHHGRPVRSESMSSRQNSFPSIHHGRPIRSESMSSRQNSITTFDSSVMEWFEERDPSNVKDEKKDEDGIPEKVVIPTTGPPSSLQDSQQILEPESCSIHRPVLMRHASSGADYGEGIEVADYDLDTVRETAVSPRHSGRHSENWEFSSIHTSNSFDETMSFGRVSNIFRSRPALERAMSDDDIRGMYLGDSRAVFRESFTSRGVTRDEDESGYRIDDDGSMDYYDSWMVIEDEYVNGYGGGGTLSFHILGTSARDKSAMPHVLSPPLMESLQAFFPFGKFGESYWLKYSMVRDGAGLNSLLRHARGSKYSILAIETTDGEVFGAFLGEAWRKNWNYYGSEQSFVWRMRHSRREKTHSIIDQAHMESEIDVFPHTSENKCFQLCTDENIAVGGGTYDPVTSSHSLTSDPDTQIKAFEWGPSIILQDDLLQGSSYPCLTFDSPSLSTSHSNGSLFEIINVELWTLTPCLTLDEAEKLELGRLFLEKHGKFS